MKRVLVLCMVAAGLAGVPLAPARAEESSLSCRASALRIDTPAVDSEPTVANDPNDPCADDSAQTAATSPGIAPLVVADTLNAETDAEATSGQANASIENAAVKVIQNTVITLPVLGQVPIPITIGSLAADVLEAEAKVECVDGAAVLSGSSLVTGLSINGSPVATLDAPPNTVVLDLPGGVLKVTLNEQTTVAGELTVRALPRAVDDPRHRRRPGRGPGGPPRHPVPRAAVVPVLRW